MDHDRRVNAILCDVWRLCGEALVKAVDRRCGEDGELRRAVDLRLAERSSGRETERAFVSNNATLVGPPRNVAGLPKDIGQFAILEEIGRGGFGIVYLGRHRRSEKVVAIKVPKPGTAAARDRQWFEREARMAAKLPRHENIVGILHADATSDGRPYIVAEYVKGKSLRKHLSDGGTFTPEEARDLIIKVLWALEHAHSVGVFHGDLTPGNILLDANGEPRVTDFGMAHCLTDTELLGFGGTRQYMAPELLSGRQRTPTVQSDLWAAGVIFYELLTGSMPFKVIAAPTGWSLTPDTPVPAHNANPRVPASINHMCMRFFNDERAV